jgi:hypothetical protein
VELAIIVSATVAVSLAIVFALGYLIDRNTES